MYRNLLTFCSVLFLLWFVVELCTELECSLQDGVNDYVTFYDQLLNFYIPLCILLTGLLAQLVLYSDPRTGPHVPEPGAPPRG